MNTVANLLRKFQTLNPDAVSERAVAQTKDQLLTINKRQLFDGKLRTGQDLSPTYLEDPYFKTPAAAQRYSDWKDRITPNPKRKKGVANLFIDGTYHGSIEITVDGDIIHYGSTFAHADAIEAEFTENIYGVGGEYKSEYLDGSLRPAFKGLMEAATGLKLT